MNWFTIVLSSTPMMVVILIVACWLLAWMELGYRPRPWLDDPKGIDSAILQVCYFTTMLSFVAVLPALFLAAVLLIISGIRCFFEKKHLRPFLLVLVYSITIVAAMYIVLKMLPPDIGDWLMD